MDLGEIKAETGDRRRLTVTGSLNGDVFEEDTKVTLVGRLKYPPEGHDATTRSRRDTQYAVASFADDSGRRDKWLDDDYQVTAMAGGDKKVVEIGSVTKDPIKKVQYR